jgi:hypothetical protein
MKDHTHRVSQKKNLEGSQAPAQGVDLEFLPHYNFHVACSYLPLHFVGARSGCLTGPCFVLRLSAHCHEYHSIMRPLPWYCAGFANTLDNGLLIHLTTVLCRFGLLGRFAWELAHMLFQR